MNIHKLKHRFDKKKIIVILIILSILCGITALYHNWHGAICGFLSCFFYVWAEKVFMRRTLLTFWQFISYRILKKNTSI